MASKLSKDNIKPNDFKVGDHLWNSPFQNSEKETIARNIILISKWNGNNWLDFTWDEYQKMCKHNVTISEKGVLDGFVSQGLLACKNGVYSVEESFIRTLAQFIA